MAETYAMDRIAAQSSDMIYHRSPSYGTFSTSMQVQYNFGMAQKVLFSGVVMDMDRIESNTESRENCYEDWVAFNRSSGMRSSAYEHIIPERLFSTEDEQAEGVSTAKALFKAMVDGQRIYTLTEDNEEQLSNITIDDEARSEIQQALSRGYEVTVHQQPINVNGWEGSGYSIIDPERGVGAYKISGGASGGEIRGAIGFLINVLGLSASAGELLEESAILPGVIARVISNILGPLSVLFSVFDAKMSGCGRAASFGVTAFSIAGWIGVLTLSLFAVPLLFSLGIAAAITVGSAFLQESIKQDFCGN